MPGHGLMMMPARKAVGLSSLESPTDMAPFEEGGHRRARRSSEWIARRRTGIRSLTRRARLGIERIFVAVVLQVVRGHRRQRTDTGSIHAAINQPSNRSEQNPSMSHFFNKGPVPRWPAWVEGIGKPHVSSGSRGASGFGLGGLAGGLRRPWPCDDAGRSRSGPSRRGRRAPSTRARGSRVRDSSRTRTSHPVK